MKNKLIQAILLVLLIFISQCYAFNAVRIVPFKTRTLIIDTAQKYIHREGKQSLESIPIEWEALENPFLDPTLQKEAIEAASQTTLAEENPVKNEPVSDEALLEQIATVIQPTGNIFKNGEYVLLFDNSVVKKGDFIYAKMNEKRYQIYFEAIEENTYTLRYKEARIKKDFDVLTIAHE